MDMPTPPRKPKSGIAISAIGLVALGAVSSWGVSYIRKRGAARSGRVSDEFNLQFSLTRKRDRKFGPDLGPTEGDRVSSALDEVALDSSSKTWWSSVRAASKNCFRSLKELFELEPFATIGALVLMAMIGSEFRYIAEEQRHQLWLVLNAPGVGVAEWRMRALALAGGCVAAIAALRHFGHSFARLHKRFFSGLLQLFRSR